MLIKNELEVVMTPEDKKEIKTVLAIAGGILGISILGPILRPVIALIILISPLFAFTNQGVAMPKEKHGEFPFRLEYEIDGQNHVIEDVLIIKYAGIERSIEVEPSILWLKKLKSDPKSEDVLLLETEEKDRVYYYTGHPHYLMGENYGDLFLYNGESVYVLSSTDKKNTWKTGITADEMYDEYGIKIISFDIADPIADNFPDSEMNTQ